MDGSHMLMFGSGAVVGFLLGVLLTRWYYLRNAKLPELTINQVLCQANGELEIDYSLTSPPAGFILQGLHTKVYDDPTHTPPATPVGENPTSHSSTTSPITHPATTGMMGPTDLLAVWAEYKAYVLATSVISTCVARGSDNKPACDEKQGISPTAAEQLEAIPRAYRVSPETPPAGTGSGPAAELTGLLAPEREAVLEYVPEASSPIEPFWQARDQEGPVREWSLMLLRHPGGFGAVLSAVCLVGGRETRVTWVTSTWRFHTVNRLCCESAEAGGLTLLVRPQ